MMPNFLSYRHSKLLFLRGWENLLKHWLFAWMRRSFYFPTTLFPLMTLHLAPYRLFSSGLIDVCLNFSPSLPPSLSLTMFCISNAQVNDLKIFIWCSCQWIWPLRATSMPVWNTQTTWKLLWVCLTVTSANTHLWSSNRFDDVQGLHYYLLSFFLSIWNKILVV